MRRAALILSISAAVFTVLSIFSTAAVADWQVVQNPETSVLEAVSSDPNGTAADILYSYFDGSTWSPAVTLSELAKADASPVLAFDGDGGRRIVWQSASDTIVLKTQAAGSSTWTPESTVSHVSETASNPWVVVDGENDYVSFEVLPAEGPRYVVVSKFDPEGHVERSFEVSSNSSSEVHPQLHTGQGFVWVDWIDSDSTMGFSVLINGAWTSVDFEAYSGTPGVTTARARIAEIVMGN